MDDKQSTKLTIEKINGFAYSEKKRAKAKVDSKTGSTSFPKDIWWDTEIRGFGVRVFPTGTKSYVFQYRNGAGQKKFLTIGDTGKISLKEARDRCKKRAVNVIDGPDPASDRKRAQADTYLRFIEETYQPYLVAHLRGGINNEENVKETMATLRRTFPELHPLALKEITPFM